MIYTCVKLCVGPKKLMNEVELLKIIFQYLLELHGKQEEN